MTSADAAFRTTPVPLRICPVPIGMGEKSLWMGSCFTSNLGLWLSSLGYPVLSNPFGVVFHPLVMEKLLTGNPEDFFPYNFERQGVWLNFLLGTPFFARDEETLCRQISEASTQCRSWLQESNWLVLTFGTAFHYRHPQAGMVGKCHKLPGSQFEKKRNSVSEISGVWTEAILKLRSQNPSLKLLFTLSPVRHSRDGMEENMVSKSILRLSIEELCTALPSVYYFPAFELMNDELRDYRFYASDLVHPSEEAIRFLRKQFEARFLKPDESELRQLGEEIQRMEQHRPQAEWTMDAGIWKKQLEEKKQLHSALLAAVHPEGCRLNQWSLPEK
jgi:hypothetical protein